MKNNNKNPWFWIPTLYFAEGLPYVIIMTVSVIMYKNLGISNSDIALYTSWLYLPWVIKPFWSPIIDMFKTKRWWILTMQILLGGGLAGVAFAIPTTLFFQISLAVFWLLAFSSATHDIAADGFYMIALDEHNQSLFVGIRSTFYRIASIMGQGIVVMIAGYLEKYYETATAWSYTFLGIAILILLISIYHYFSLPKISSDKAIKNGNELNTFIHTFISFFQKKQIGIALLFMLIYRLGEAQLVKIASPFLLDSAEAGGLSLSTTEVGFIYGTIGVIALTLGGILGGIVVAASGIGKWKWPMILCMNIPNLVYVYLSIFTPAQYWITCTCIALEQFGYGFGFTLYMLYLIYFAQGENKTAHYAICTGIMAIGMMLPGMVSGYIQEAIGYQNFFIWVCICTIPSFIILKYLPFNSNFGKK